MGRAALSQMPCEKRCKIGRDPRKKHGHDREKTDSAALPRQQTHEQRRQRDRNDCVDGAGGPVTQDTVTGSGDDQWLWQRPRRRHHRVERRGKNVADGGDRRSDDHNPVLH